MNKEQALQRLTAIEKEAKELRKIIEQPEEKKPTPEEVFWKLCDGLEVKIDKDISPNRIFFFKGDSFFFEWNTETRTLWCSYKNVWSVLEMTISTEYNEVQGFIKKQVEEHFKCNGVTPLSDGMEV